MEGNEMLRVLVFQEGGDWVAQCLEYDICTHAQDEESLSKRFSALLEVEYNISMRECGKPFAGIEPAPEEYQAMWPKADDGSFIETPAGSVELKKKCA
jgi:hypothetical protein